jgi:cell division protein FtsW (lipid II flippase)
MTASDRALSRLEEHLGRLLLGGVLSAALLLAVGLALWMSGAWPHAADWILNAGLFVLMATPILRVVVSVVEYARMRDWFFVATTMTVLLVLLVTVVVALTRARA